MATEESLLVKVEYVDVFDFPDLSSVGHVYQVGINGTGYMLADNPDKGMEYRRQVIPLDPQRLATSDTPFSEAIERYSFAAADEWTAGAGQKYLHRGSSTASGYWESIGLDPFTDPGKIKLLPSVVQEVASNYAHLRHVVVGNSLYVQTADLTLKYVTSPGGSETSVTVAGSGGAITDLTSDGQQWYACNGADIFAGTTSTPGSAWSTQDAYEVKWAAGRICAAVASAGSTPNRFTTLNSSGAEEKANGHLTLPAGTTITLGGTTGGHFYFGGSASATGSVYAWKLGVDESGDFFVPFEALELPAGLEVSAVAVGGGYVWVRAYRPEGTNKGQALIYQCVVDSGGALIATTVTEIAPVGTTADHKVGGFATHEDLVLFGWKTMANGNAGTGAVSLTTGGWAKWHEANVDGDVSTIDVWQGLPVFSVRGHGVYRTHASQFVTAGELKSSFADGASGLFKVWDDVTLTMDPLGSGESITVSVTVDGGANYTSLTGGTVSEQLKTHTVEIGKQSKELGLKLSFVGNASGDCALTFLSARYHPLGLSDTIVQIPVDCGDHLRSSNGSPLAENGEGAGVRRARALQNLVQSRVKFQDVDWHITGSTEIFEIEACDINAVSLYEPSRSSSALRLIAVLTLRKVGS